MSKASLLSFRDFQFKFPVADGWAFYKASHFVAFAKDVLDAQSYDDHIVALTKVSNSQDDYGEPEKLMRYSELERLMNEQSR